jgi:hypothetical protein
VSCFYSYPSLVSSLQSSDSEWPMQWESSHQSFHTSRQRSAHPMQIPSSRIPRTSCYCHRNQGQLALTSVCLILHSKPARDSASSYSLFVVRLISASLAQYVLEGARWQPRCWVLSILLNHFLDSMSLP